jgi:uncharacterized protein YjbJ (UPF0337 family)
MTEDNSSSSSEHLKGSVKEALGKLTGDAGIEAEGRRQKREARDTKPEADKSGGGSGPSRD